MGLRRLIGRAFAPRALPALPPGIRLYAIGDIHGRLDLLDDLLARIAADDASRARAPGRLVFLGDYIDRGPESCGVIERLAGLRRAGHDAVFLTGNHEEVMLSAAAGDRAAAGLFDRIGGRETLLSYGVAPQAYDAVDLGGVAGLIADHVPPAHLAWLETLAPSFALGDYLFVHAGIRPGAPIGEQAEKDMRWIRDVFLDDTRDHGAMIVHGHSVAAGIDERPNRIGIDTGACISGHLTALGLEGETRWFLQT